jgi:hypothetical protein
MPLSASQQVAQAAAQGAMAAMQAQTQTPSGTTTGNVAAATQAITAQQSFIIESFRGQIYISDELDVQDTPVYDTLTYTAGGTINTPNSALFSNVESNSGKTYAQTNMQENRRLAAPEAFSVFGVRLGFSENILYSDLITWFNSWAYEFWLGQKNYQRANVRHFSSGWGMAGYTTNTAQSFFTNGSPGRGSMNMVMVKLVIANQMSFFGQFTGSSSQTLSSGGTGAIFLNELVGLYARGVQ